MKIGINYETPECIERMQNIILTFYNDFFHPLETIMLILMRTRKDIQNHYFIL